MKKIDFPCVTKHWLRRTPRWLMPSVMATAVAIGVGFASSAATAREHRDHDDAREAVRAGEILPLTDVLQRLEKDQPGQVLEVELERKHDRIVYEVKLLQPGGRVVKYLIDARTGELIQHKR